MARPADHLVVVALVASMVVLGSGSVPIVGAAERAPDPVPWGIEAMYNASSLRRTSGGDGIDVAILDTGVDRDHPDLNRRIERCRDYTGDTIDHGSCKDVDGHGTHVAGTVAADGGRDGEGLWGVAPEADVWAFKVCRDDGRCATDRIGRAIRDSADLGAEVVVISLGGQPEPFVQSALHYSFDHDVLPVASAGNEGPDLATMLYPGADRLAVGVAAVGRVRSDGGNRPANLAVPAFSSRGEDTGSLSDRDNLTEVAGPGVHVISTAVGGGYSQLSGTSMAAPHVAGLAARLWKAVGDADGDGRVRDDVREALRRRAASGDITRGEHARTGYDPASGVGLPRLTGPIARIVGPSGPLLVGENATFRATATGPAPIVAHEWDLDGNGTFEARGPVVDHAFGTSGVHEVRLRVTDDHGATARATLSVRVHTAPRAAFRTTPVVPLAGAPVELDASASSDAEGPIVAYRWEVEGVGSLEGVRNTTILPEPGPVEVTLTVIDADEASDTATRTVLVNDEPTVRLDLPDDATAGTPVQLRADVVDEIGNVTVRWRLPEDRNLTGSTVEATFEAGDHPIEVTARDSHGAEGRADGILQVAPADLVEELPAAGPVAAAAALAVTTALRRRW